MGRGKFAESLEHAFVPLQEVNLLSGEKIMSQLQDVKTLADRADARIAAAKTAKEVLDATIRAAELYMRALKLTKDPLEKHNFDAKCKQRLKQAEKIKASEACRPGGRAPSDAREKLVAWNPKKHITKRQLSTREKIILLEGSKLHGFVFPPWDESPEAEEFRLADDQDQYTDAPALRLSKLQLKHFEGWRRPAEALAKVDFLSGRDATKLLPTMHREGKTDLVQDITTDCSVVASLCAGTARVERGHTKILQSRIFPYDDDNNRPAISPNGKYILRLRFNGCNRKVVIDDLLPMSSTSRVLHVVDRQNSSLLWPALVEKAYLKARGGYDFPGSNSGTDLAILTGWIPEQVILNNDDVLPDVLWKRISSGFEHGDVLLTIGTGKLTKKEEKQLGLVREHDYAILHLREVNGIREMLIKNPWSDGTIWKGRTRSSVNLTQSPRSHTDSFSIPEQRDGSFIPGTFWMDLDSVFQHFENLYLNWNPDLFTYCEEIHFSWNALASANISGCFVSNPQFAISIPTKGTVWLQLNRHFQTDTTPGDEKSYDTGYISLYLFATGGKRVFLSDGALERGPYVDSPNTLLKVELSANTVYTVVVASQMLCAKRQNFTLSSLGWSPLSLTEAEAVYLSSKTVTAAWTLNTAGGNSDFKTYADNPQFSLVLSSAASIAVLLEVSKDTLEPPAVHAKLFFSPSRSRITRIRTRDILASTGDYRRQSAVLEAQLDAGAYSIICSTFEPGQLATFSITIHSTIQGLQLSPHPAEDAGRMRVKSEIGALPAGAERLMAPIAASRVAKVKFILRHVRPMEPGQHHLSVAVYHPNALRLLIQQGQGSYSSYIASSHEEGDHDLAMDETPRIEDIDLRPDMTRAEATGGIWLVVERAPCGPSATRTEELFEVEALCDERIAFGKWR